MIRPMLDMIDIVEHTEALSWIGYDKAEPVTQQMIEIFVDTFTEPEPFIELEIEP